MAINKRGIFKFLQEANWGVQLFLVLGAGWFGFKIFQVIGGIFIDHLRLFPFEYKKEFEVGGIIVGISGVIWLFWVAMKDESGISNSNDGEEDESDFDDSGPERIFNLEMLLVECPKLHDD